MAVVVLTGEAGESCIPIFQRTSGLRRHPGQMALPGGRIHDRETAEDGAIRELFEELGLTVSPSNVLGRLDDFDTVSGFTITPVVIWGGGPASDLRPSPDEVHRLFVVPTADLRAAAREALRGDAFSMRLPEVEVFAPTAAILFQFSEVALEGRDARVADFYQPPWTHR